MPLERKKLPKGVYKRPDKPRKDLTGQKFGKLTALYCTKPYINKNGVVQNNYWMFKCECGNEKEILASSVTRKNLATKSCGCISKVAKERLGSQERINFLRNGLRGLWVKWPPRYHVKAAAKKARGIYLCAGFMCEPHEVRHKDVEIDHKVPIGELTDWESYINALFCPAENLQVLCKECHKRKTAEERLLAKNNKKDNNEISII